LLIVLPTHIYMEVGALLYYFHNNNWVECTLHSKTEKDDKTLIILRSDEGNEFEIRYSNNNLTFLNKKLWFHFFLVAMKKNKITLS